METAKRIVNVEFIENIMESKDPKKIASIVVLFFDLMERQVVAYENIANALGKK